MTRPSGPSAFGRPSICCAILAAGDSSRFGGANKLLAKFRGRPLLQHAVDAARASNAVACLLIVGDDAEAIENGIETRRCAIVHHAGWSEGIASSIRCAIATRGDDDACIFLVGDEPFVGAGDINALIAEHEMHPKAIVALRARKTWGTPALFPNSDYAGLLRLKGDRGAKGYAERRARRLRFVSASHPQAFSDVDTRADLRRLASTRHPRIEKTRNSPVSRSGSSITS